LKWISQYARTSPKISLIGTLIEWHSVALIETYEMLLIMAFALLIALQ
jgi:hypothetical protein